LKSEELAVSVSMLYRTYDVGEVTVEVLKGVELSVEEGEFTTICGPSGSGKTTLLNIIGGLDRPTGGTVVVFGEDLSIRDEDFLAAFRCSKIGFVFQSYNLISTLTVAENVGFPMEWIRKPADHVEKRVHDLLTIVGLNDRAEHFPFQLSGGEQQRVALARALANNPPLLLVDEPTGNLDKKNSAKITEILRELKDEGKTIVVATHDEGIARLADQRLQLEDGKLVSDDD
jgi:putative ABC transport system ATP-binding protein